MHDISTVRVVDNKVNLPWSVYVGVCGMPGKCNQLHLGRASCVLTYH